MHDSFSSTLAKLINNGKENSLKLVKHGGVKQLPLWTETCKFVVVTCAVVDGMKMGKSLGNTLEPNDLVQRFGADAVRYFFVREVECGGDGDYSEDRFINIVNAHLANTIAVGNVFGDTIERLIEKAHDQYGNLALSSACEVVLEIGNAGNLYMDERAPWSLLKKGGAASEAASKDLVIILEAMRIIAIALSPVTPNVCFRIYEQLGYTEDQF